MFCSRTASRCRRWLQLDRLRKLVEALRAQIAEKDAVCRRARMRLASSPS
jgi:hypothetical protein